MKRILILLCALALLFTACAAQPGPEPETTIETTLISETSDRGWAYCQAFLYLLQTDGELGGGDKYLAMDMTNVQEDARAALERLMRDYCAGKGQTFLVATYEELVRQGHINEQELYFEEGILYQFGKPDEPIVGKVGPDEMVFAASKWKGGLAGYGATFFMKLSDEKWTLNRTENEWIS